MFYAATESTESKPFQELLITVVRVWHGLSVLQIQLKVSPYCQSRLDFKFIAWSRENSLTCFERAMLRRTDCFFVETYSKVQLSCCGSLRHQLS